MAEPNPQRRGTAQVDEMNAYAPIVPAYPPAARPGREVRLREIGALVMRRAPLIITTAAIVVFLAVLYVAQVRTQYAASSQILLDPRKSSVENTAAVLSNLTVDQPTILNQIEILSSHRFVAKIVDQFHLDRDPEFTAQGFAAKLFSSTNDPREIAIAKLRNALKVAQAGFSSTIRIQVTASDRKKAGDIAAAMADTYVREQLEIKSAASRQASGWLTQRVNELAQKVKDAEAAVQKYKADRRLTINAGGVSVTEQQISDLNAQLTVAQTDYDDKAAKAARIDTLIKSGKIASTPQVIASPLISAMRTQQTELNRQIADLTARYGPNHPKMKELTSQRADLAEKISAEILRIADSVRNEADTAQAHVASLEKSLHQTEALNARKNEDSVELAGLQSAAASARAMYQAFLSQYSQTENQQGILRPDAYVISTSDVEETFGAQTKLLAVLSAIPAGLLLGLALAFMAGGGQTVPQQDNYQPKDLRPRQSRPAVRLQAAAVLPEMGSSLRAADLVITHPQSPFAMAVSALLTRLLANAAPPMTVVVTAMTPGAGKTTLCLSLARAAAKAGIRTIVIDANGYLCHLGTMAGKKSVPGARSNMAQAEDYISADPLSPALVMAADPTVPGYEKTLTPAHLTRLIANLKASFDLVIIAAPLLGDGLAQSLLAEAGIVLVAIPAREATSRQVIQPAPSALTVITHA